MTRSDGWALPHSKDGRQEAVSAEVLREAGENDHGAESLGLVQVKGRDEPIEIYRLARSAVTRRCRDGETVLRGSLRKVRALMLC
jgi:class 3 adenylate cyclase